MPIIKRFVVTLLIALLIVPGTLAQNPSQQSSQTGANQTAAGQTAAGQIAAQDVLIIIQQEKVRFTAQKAVQEMRLQIFDQTGELVFDSGPIAEPELNWPLQNGNGEKIKSGLYAYTLSVKEAGAETARERRGHFIVDKAKDRDGNTDKLWVTSQSDNGVGTELTVARDERTTIAGASTGIDRKSAPERKTTKTDGVEVTPGEKQELFATAANGTIGQIAKFTTATDLGNSVITEQNGNIGVGTATPGFKLDVAGNVRAAKDISNDIVVQTTGGTNAWARLSMMTPSQRWALGTSQNYNGNQFYLYDATFNQVRMSIQPNAGEVSFPSPSSNHIAVRTSGGTNSWAQFRVATINQAWTLGTSQNYNGDQFYLFDQTRNQPRLTIQPNGGAIAFPTGKVGIGTSNPNHQLSLGRGPTWTTNGWGGSLELDNATAIGWKANAAGQRFGMGHTNTGFYIFRTTSDPGTAVSAADYDLSISDTGVTGVRVLQINGGADFAESFDINDAAGSEALKAEPGLVVTIDPERPGKLQLSTQAYDQGVAGIISGAGGVKPGMMMGQPGTLADGKYPVALTGRVYCWADASQGAIVPGNLLTTSTTPGHAMKVSDREKAQGAILGKALTGLKEGKGLVLVLVTLQ